jgi:hypothetical protein
MKSLALVLVVAASGCQGGEQSAGAAPSTAAGSATTAEYAKDIERLCNVMTLSGADQQGPGDRMLTTANWLSENMKTPEAKRFMLQTNQTPADTRAAVLEAEATRVGLTGCPLAAMWR